MTHDAPVCKSCCRDVAVRPDQRILIVRMSALGDVALTLPLLFLLRGQLPEAHIGWVIEKRFSPLLKGIDCLDRIHIWEDRGSVAARLIQLIKEIRSERYDCSVDPQGLTRSAVIPFAAGIPMRIGFIKSNLEGRELAPLFTNRRIAPPCHLRHVASRTLFLARGLGLEPVCPGPLPLPHDCGADATIDRWWGATGLGPRTIIFGIGAGWRTRMWPVEEMSLLVEKAVDHGYHCIILWGPYERGHIKNWQLILDKRVIFAPPTDIPEMIALLRRCERYAGPDSAALHLAWLLDKPTFSWFGASDPARCAPRGPAHGHVARGPHNWNRKRAAATGLSSLKGAEALPEFEIWLTRRHPPRPGSSAGLKGAVRNEDTCVHRRTN